MGKRPTWCHNPQALLDTMLFMNGMYFALRSGAEHRQLRYHPCQIELVERQGERSHMYLRYTEDISKNKPGGLKGQKQSPKLFYTTIQNVSLLHSSSCTLSSALPIALRTHSIFNLEKALS